MRTIVLAARAGALFSGDTGGTGLEDSDFVTDANKLIDGFSAGKQASDEKDVHVKSQAVHGRLKTAPWYLVARSDKTLNRDTKGGVGSTSSMTHPPHDSITAPKSRRTSTKIN